jgi:putative ABC transport system substrate-binding protein
MSTRLAAIREGLNKSDKQASPPIEIVVRVADGNLSRLPELAKELVDKRVDVILAFAPPAIQAARGATATIPIVALDLESDPVASALIASIGRPGGNVTGVFLDFPDFAAKCLQLLIESVPALAAVGVLWEPAMGSLQVDAVQAAARSYGIRVEVLEARGAADIAEAFYALERSHLSGLLVLSSPLLGGNPQMLADLAMRKKVPTISMFPEIAREGGLLSYGPEIQDLFRQVASMGRKVLDGTKPADMPVERPTKFALVVNVRTAKLFGITLPPSILLRADEVIE